MENNSDIQRRSRWAVGGILFLLGFRLGIGIISGAFNQAYLREYDMRSSIGYDVSQIDEI